jgi:hypothetical protein
MRTRFNVDKNASFASQAKASTPRLETVRATKVSIGNVLSLKRPTVNPFKALRSSEGLYITVALLPECIPID